jgi:hypothetical protein
MTNERTSAPVACSLEREDLANRHERWRTLQARGAVTTARTADGLRLTFGADPGLAEELEELVALERECCAFADWSVTTRSEDVVLDVTAHNELGVAAVQAMFGGSEAGEPR